MMNTFKISLSGKSFALAKTNDSEGKKSRIRRSKEERKDMVESFIKKYQKANNGSFPSLTLTQKEVGGSFYTIREIIRDVIQENRVLGPAKLTSEEINAEQVCEHYPLGSISTEPQSPLFISSSGSCFVSSDHQSIHKDLVSSFGRSNGYVSQTSDNEKYVDGMLPSGEYEVSNTGESLEHVSVEAQVDDEKAIRPMVQAGGTSSGQSAGHNKLTSNNGVYINSLHMGGEYEESNAGKSLEQGSVTACVDKEPIFIEGQVCEEMNGVENVKEAPIAKVDPLAVDVIVEEQGSVTTHVDKEPIFIEGQACEKMDGVENVKEAPVAKVNPLAVDVIVETFPLRSVGSPIHDMDPVSGEAREVMKFLEEQEAKKMEVATGNTDLIIDRIESLEEISRDLRNKKASVNIAKTFQENLSSFASQSSASTSLLENMERSVGVVENDVSTLKTADTNKTVIGSEPDLVPAEVLSQNGTASGSSAAFDESLSQEAINKARADIKQSQRTGKRSNTTSNRLNLESRDGTSEKSVKKEINPLWTVLRAFVSAFVKFWSE